MSIAAIKTEVEELASMFDQAENPNPLIAQLFAKTSAELSKLSDITAALDCGRTAEPLTASDVLALRAQTEGLLSSIDDSLKQIRTLLSH